MPLFTGFALGAAGVLLVLVLVGLLLGPRHEARAEDPRPDGSRRMRRERRKARRDGDGDVPGRRGSGPSAGA